MTDILTVFGTIVSVGSAGFSFLQAKRAKDYSEQAQAQVSSRRAIEDLAALKVRYDTTYRALAPFGPGASTRGLRGQAPTEAARVVQDYIEEVRRHKSSLSAIGNLDDRLTEADSLLQAFSKAGGTKELKERGTALLSQLSDMNAAIHGVLVSLREHVDLS